MAITKTTTYLGNVERIESSNSNTITWRRTVAGAVYITKTDKSYQTQGSVDKSYIYKDHLGSTDVITGKTGTIKQSMSFDAWGQRRDSNSWDPISDAAKRAFNTELTNDGFTGHEQLDEVGLIHMNGRVYDPKLARFLQADPFIQAPSNTQSYNRYSYVLNNPLNATDPSGYFFDKVGDLFKQIAGAVVAVAMTAWCGPACGAGVWKAITIGGVSGAVGAAANGGNVLKGALTGALGGAMFYGVGQAFSGTEGLFAEGGFGHISAHGLTGGVMSEIRGGQFKHGFISAGFTKAMNINGIQEGDISASAVATRVTTAALVGGTASRISGGKFANGAVTAALAQAVNGEEAQRSAARERDGFFKGLWKKATAWHFEDRHAKNGPLLNMDVAEEQGFYGGVPASYHQDGVPGEEIKLVHPDGREMIYDGISNQPVGMDRAGIMGTYNYVSMPEMPASGAGIWANVKFGANFIVRGVGHGVVDVLPYKILGGNVRGSECQVNNCAQ